jgi:hypothetical protein
MKWDTGDDGWRLPEQGFYEALGRYCGYWIKDTGFFEKRNHYEKIPRQVIHKIGYFLAG